MNFRQLAMLAALVSPTIGGAQVFTHGREALPGTTLHQYIGSQEHHRELASIGIGWDKGLKLHEACQSQRFVKLKAIVIYVPIEIEASSPHPIKGLWQERFDFERCGESKTYNVLFGAQSGTKPRFALLYPGESLASAQLYLDARKVAFVSIASALPKQSDGKYCDGIVISDIKVAKGYYEASIPGRGAVPGVWEEAWAIAGCGGESQLLVTFVPDGKGGTSFFFKQSPNPALQSTQ